MKSNVLFFILFILIVSCKEQTQNQIHVWEKQQLTFIAENNYDNPYTFQFRPKMVPLIGLK